LKDILIKFKQHPKYDTIVSWGKLISITGSAQIIVQAVGFASGILIIRLLPVQEYAFYTLANTMLGTMTVLADGGITTGVMAQGGKVWEDKEKMGIVLATGLDLRRKFALGSLLVSLPILLYLLVHNGASWIISLLIVLALIPAFYASLSDSILEIIPKLNQSIFPLQLNQVKVGIGRLILSGLTMLIFPWAFVAVLAAGIPRIWGNIDLRKIVYASASENQQPDILVKKEIIKLVKRILPTSIYYCLSGQITIWIISIFGNTTSLAQLGALTRLSVMLSILGILLSTLVIPRYAKIPLDKKVLLQRFIQIMLILTLLSFFIVLIVYFFPKPILWILGTGYMKLNYELLLTIIGSCISLLSATAFSIYSCRGWTLSPFVLIGINLSAIIFFSILLDLSNLEGVLLLNIGLGLVALLQTTIFRLFKILQINPGSYETTK
jgi:O-antigen/teichoic acid export membrane protein